MSPLLEGHGLMKKREYSIFLCSAPCCPGPGSSGMSPMCAAMYSDVLSWLLYPSDQSYVEVCLGSGLWAVLILIGPVCGAFLSRCTLVFL